MHRPRTSARGYAASLREANATRHTGGCTRSASSTSCHAPNHPTLNDADPLDAAWSALHYNDHHGHHVRKLTELTQWVTTELADQAVDYGAKLAPIVFGESSGQLPSENPNLPEEAGVEGLRQVARFIAYGKHTH
jgi:hypothetical protein